MRHKKKSSGIRIEKGENLDVLKGFSLQKKESELAEEEKGPMLTGKKTT